MTQYREQALLLGENRSLVAIHCVPTAGVVQHDVTVVILNAGIIHRVGANRMHVELARKLASNGYPALRFDLSGIGDSKPRQDELSLLEGAMQDIREVLDHLSTVRPGTSFVLFGLCSGALHSLMYGPDDPRVEGLVLLDLLIPRTPGYWKRNVMRRVVNVLTTGGSLRRTPARAQEAIPERSEEDLRREAQVPLHLLQVKFSERFQKAFARNVPMFAGFTDGLEQQHNYREQILDAFPEITFGKLMQLEYYIETDHTFSNEVKRAMLVDTILNWLNTTFGARPAQSAAVAAVEVSDEKVPASADREDLSF